MKLNIFFEIEIKLHLCNKKSYICFFPRLEIGEKRNKDIQLKFYQE